MSGPISLNGKLAKVGEKLWAVDFAVDYLDDIECRLDEDYDEVALLGEVDDFGKFLRQCVKELKEAISSLPQDIASSVATGFFAEDEASKARGAAQSLLAGIQRTISERNADQS